MGSHQFNQSGLFALAALLLLAQGCAPVSPSFSKSATDGKTDTGGGASLDVNAEPTDEIVLEDSRAKVQIVIGTKAADEAIRSLPDSFGKPSELTLEETERFKSSGTYTHSIRTLDTRRVNASTAIIVLDPVAAAAHGITEEMTKAFKFKWSMDLDRRTIEIEVSKKTPKSSKTAVLESIKSVVIAIGTIR